MLLIARSIVITLTFTVVSGGFFQLQLIGYCDVWQYEWDFLKGPWTSAPDY